MDKTKIAGKGFWNVELVFFLVISALAFSYIFIITIAERKINEEENKITNK